MSRFGETVLVLALVAIAGLYIFDHVDCGKIPWVGTYCVATK